MKVSVIIPLYNKEHYIKGTIESVLSQTFKDLEVIIINDGSTDASEDIAKSINDPRIKTYTQINHGVSYTRNRGIDLAKGDYIAFLDADDKWKPNYLEKMIMLAEKYPFYHIFCSAQDGRPIPTLPLGVTIIYDYCKYDYIFWTGCLLIKKEVFRNVGGFRTGIQLGEDLDMWLRIACKYTTIYLNEELAYHPYVTENNLARSIDISSSFPYWEWYDYPYHNKKSLYKYTTNQIVRCAEELVNQKRYQDSWCFLMKTKGYTSIRPRIKLVFKILFKL